MLLVPTRASVSPSGSWMHLTHTVCDERSSTEGAQQYVLPEDDLASTLTSPEDPD